MIQRIAYSFLFSTMSACAFVTNVHAQDIVSPNASMEPYQGVLTLDIDATDLERKIVQVKQSLPVKPGKLVLFYPRWLPGTHSPSNSAVQLAGLIISANGKTIEWQRDPLDTHTFHVVVPNGANQLSMQYQFLSPVEAAQGRIVLAPEIIGLQWNATILYPAGHDSRVISVKPSIKLPAGWQFASGLDADGTAINGKVNFKPVSLETLIDSPLWAGKYFKKVTLDSNPSKPVYLNMFADRPTSLEATEEQINAHKALVKEADNVFVSRPYRRYEFLLAMSDTFGGIGLEHHESSENGVKPEYFTEWKKTSVGRSLLPHEYTHSWNGKYRRPSDLWTPHFNVPMQNSLLWVYEGQTQYWGAVLAARSGIVPLEDTLQALAQTAANFQNRAGREWRNLQDTTNEPIISSRRQTGGWGNWQRGAGDYYDESLLIWLDADTKIREATNNTKSMNDFARAFFGVSNGKPDKPTAPVLYKLEDVITMLNNVAPYDWKRFLRERVEATNVKAPLDGITRGGWKLVYEEVQTDYAKAASAQRKTTDFAYSIGFDIDKDNKLERVMWESPAFKAGLTQGMTLLAVNGVAYKNELLREAITANKNGKAPIQLIAKQGDHYRTVSIDYRLGLRYPKLVRVEGTPDRLTAILSPTIRPTTQ